MPVMSQRRNASLAPQTRLVHAARRDYGVVATPVYHASTVLFDSYADLKRGEADPLNRERMYYGRMGTPTTRSLEDALCALDGSVGAVLAPSGVASIAATLECFLRPGDELLMVDAVYGPTRKLCDGLLAERGIHTRYYDPCIDPEALRGLCSERTRLLFLESPGTASFEVQDVPGLAAVAAELGVLSAIDNTWATPLFFNPLEHGVDLAIQSGTKYLNGHADCLFGVVTTRSQVHYESLRRHVTAQGIHLAPDDAFLAHRGLRTLAVRLAAHDRAGRALASHLENRPEVSRVLHPAWPGHPGQAFFQRDFCGASGLFGVVLDGFDEARLGRFLDSLQLFGLGYSWGGFESLALPMQPQRVAGNGIALRAEQCLLRIHAGLENVADLCADLDAAFAAAADA
jgi:cystathionine beta-lyase